MGSSHKQLWGPCLFMNTIIYPLATQEGEQGHKVWQKLFKDNTLI